MKSFTFGLTAFIAVLSSCNTDPAKQQTGDTNEVLAVDTTFTAAKPKTSLGDCYVYTRNKDTASLKLSIQGEELTGQLNYNLFEKDSNTGKIAGELKGDTLIAEYTFDSEGLRSVREVIFVKKEDGNLYEGTGEVMEKGGKTVFKNRSALKFGPDMVFKPAANCK